MINVQQLINKGIEEGDFTGKADEDRINYAQELLGVSFPESYKWFLRNYGHGGIGGLEILGIARVEMPTCAEETLRFRKLGLPNNYVVIENCDEWIFCIDTSNIKEGRCPVVDWDRKGTTRVRYSNFEEYLKDRVLEALDRMGLL